MSGARGVGLGKGGAKRHRKVLRDNIEGITKPSIHRLARRGGVKRISDLVYQETRGVLKGFLEGIPDPAIAGRLHRPAPRPRQHCTGAHGSLELQRLPHQSQTLLLLHQAALSAAAKGLVSHLHTHLIATAQTVHRRRLQLYLEVLGRYWVTRANGTVIGSIKSERLPHGE